jgi:recombination endonuclease VII
VTEIEHKRDVYLKWQYGRGLKWYRRQEKKQKGKCAICRRPPKNLPLAVDHWHKIANLKIKTRKLENGLWKAYNVEFDFMDCFIPEAKYTFKSRNKKKAIKQVRLILKKKANRGLLCWACNTGIRKYFDNAEHLLAASKYLQRHQRKFRRK